MDTSDWPRGPLHRGIEVYAINLQGLQSLTGPYSSREDAKANGVTGVVAESRTEPPLIPCSDPY